jgi:hypothetical protein
MASPTKVYMTRVRLKMHKSGRKRKNRLARHGTTLPKSVFFGDTEPTPAPTRVAQ